MATLNLTQNSTTISKEEYIKNKKIEGITKFIDKAKFEFETAISKKQYGVANERKGFMEGLTEGREHLTFKHFRKITDTITWAEMELSISLGNHKYGECSKWQAYISGLNVCRSIIEGV